MYTGSGATGYWYLFFLTFFGLSQFSDRHSGQRAGRFTLRGNQEFPHCRHRHFFIPCSSVCLVLRYCVIHSGLQNFRLMFSVVCLFPPVPVVSAYEISPVIPILITDFVRHVWHFIFLSLIRQ